MRNAYLVCYDVCDDKRLRKIYRTMRGWGDHLQLSVFRCELSKKERAEMVESVMPIINQNEDQVLIVDLGPADGRGGLAFESIGRPYTAPERVATII